MVSGFISTIVFSSVNLVEALLDRNTFSCGTIRPNHRGLPGLKSDGEMGKGEIPLEWRYLGFQVERLW